MTVYDTLRNTIGYIKMDLGVMEAQISVLENPNSTAQQKTAAKNTAKQAGLNVVKMLNTIANKAGYTLTLSSTTYTDQELTEKRCLC